MSDWKEAEIADILTEKAHKWLDLWEWNNYNPPKYWFGNIVYLKGQECRIMGMEWRTKEMALPTGGALKAGWWYQVQWPKRESLQGVHEDSLYENRGA